MKMLNWTHLRIIVLNGCCFVRFNRRLKQKYLKFVMGKSKVFL
jgi:hypothetical protein